MDLPDLLVLMVVIQEVLLWVHSVLIINLDFLKDFKACAFVGVHSYVLTNPFKLQLELNLLFIFLDLILSVSVSMAVVVER